MKRFALTAVGVMAACGRTHLADVPDESLDGSVDTPDARDDEADATDAAPDRTSVVVNDAGATDVGAPPALDAGDASVDPCAAAGVPPPTLDCTGLYSDLASKTLAPGVQFYVPAVPLWSDNAQKMRWIQLPPGTQIDVSNPNEWTFPIGTKVWKEFSKNGKRVETRLFQKVEAGPPPYWVHTTYAWNDDESEAVASGGGDITLEGDGGAYHIPTFAECERCHNGRTDHILGFEQVSLGQAGAQGLTLAELVKDGLVTPAPAQTQLTLGDDGTGAAAPALAWLHVNCGVTCHNGNSNASAYGVGMRLRLDPALLDGRPVTAVDFDPLKTTLGVLANSPGWIQPVQWTRIVPGDPTDSLLVQLISNRGSNNPAGGQMPPIATSIVDTSDVAHVVSWISKLSSDAGVNAADSGADGSAGATTDASNADGSD